METPGTSGFKMPQQMTNLVLKRTTRDIVVSVLYTIFVSGGPLLFLFFCLVGLWRQKDWMLYIMAIFLVSSFSGPLIRKMIFTHYNHFQIGERYARRAGGDEMSNIKQKAIRELTLATESPDPSCKAAAFIERAFVFYEIKNLSSAIKDITVALAIDPCNVRARLLLAMIHKQKGDVVRARAEMDIARECHRRLKAFINGSEKDDFNAARLLFHQRWRLSTDEAMDEVHNDLLSPVAGSFGGLIVGSNRCLDDRKPSRLHGPL